MICWTVNGLGETLNGSCWEGQALMAAFINYSAAMRGNTSPSLCMITGSMGAPAGQHPKGIVPINGNAKLISANDSSGFTYRGRFDDAAQAATVGYAASQKAHSALRWLVANPSQYRKQLREALSGWKADLPQSAGVVITAFDATTTGRLAVTYYNELLASDFLDRLHDWEATCCWENGSYGIQSPSLFQIISWAFGTPRNGKAEPDDRILSQQMQWLVACRINRAPFPLDVERALVERASNLQLFPGRAYRTEKADKQETAE